MKRTLLGIAAVFALGAAAIAGPYVPTRTDHDGWVIVKLAGTPSEVGYQHGSLLAHEIGDAIETLKIAMPMRSGKDWGWYRETAHRIFWPKLDDEYKQEIEGIAKGAQSQGVQVDEDDILAENGYIELSMYYLPEISAKGGSLAFSRAPNACSAFVATGSETADGKVVMAHNFWWDYLMGERWNVILDITPAKGHRVMMDALPGLIDSATDWAINSAGMALCETTISDFVGFDEGGTPEFERMRKAIQYSDSLDDMDRIFRDGNNGGYANTWLMADTKTNEIGKLELGLKNVTFSKTKDGFYYGANFPENPKLIAEETPGWKLGTVTDRQKRWTQDLEGNQGKVDANMAKRFMQDANGAGALCGKGTDGGAINAKVLTADMVSKMEFWGRMGVPDGTPIVAAEKVAAEPSLKDFGSKFHDEPAFPWTLIKD